MSFRIRTIKPDVKPDVKPSFKPDVKQKIKPASNETIIYYDQQTSKWKLIKE